METRYLEHTEYGRTDRFLICDTWPAGYVVWNIGRHNFPFEGYLPLCVCDNNYHVFINSLCCIKVESEELAIEVLCEAGRTGNYDYKKFKETEYMFHIISVAKTKESWSVNHKWNYGPIEYLHDILLQDATTIKKAEQKWRTFNKNVHRVTDVETFFAWKFKNYDLVVDCGQLYFEVTEAFPGISREQFTKWVGEHLSPLQTTTW